MRLKIKHTLLLFLFFAFVSIGNACPNVTLSATNVTCFGGFDGTVDIQVTGPNGPFNISWSQGSSSGTFNNVPSGTVSQQGGLPAGVFSVYVVDQLGCTSTKTITVYQASELTGNITAIDVDCKGDASGIADLTPSGGTPPYFFNWSNGATSEDLINVIAGNYSVIISDINGCSMTTALPTTINEPAQAVQSSIVVSNVSCEFGTDGNVDLSVFGGTPPYTFDWNGGTYLTEDLSNIPANTYTVLVQDSKGCVETNSAVVTEPLMLNASMVGFNVLCNGDATGSINLTPQDGTPPYSFTWTNSSFTLGNTEDLSGLVADTYTVTITDANGCTANGSYTVTEPSQITATFASVDVSCFGFSDGSINMTTTGGSGANVYTWKNSGGSIVGTTEDLNNIPAETYTITIEDANNCIHTDDVVISQPLTPVTVSYTKVDVLCNGDNTGAIDLTVTGGSPGYVYSWSNTAISQDLTNLFATTYSVVVTDVQGCTETVVIPIIEPLQPLNATYLVQDVQCFGDSTGVIDMTTTGGTTPYDFSWENSVFALSVSSEDIINYGADTYYVTVTDNHNCVFEDTIIINQPPEMISSIVKTDVLCYGEATGIADLTVTGGVQPYAYNWSNLSILQDQNNVVAGQYNVTINDANNCILLDSVEIDQPLDTLNSTHNIVEPTCPGYTDGQIFYVADGGTPPYSYFWSNGQFNPNAFNLSSGAYFMTLTDANGCVRVDSIFLTQPDFVTINSVIEDVKCFGGNDGSIDITPIGGSPPFTYEWTNSTYELSTADEDLFGYTTDIYTVTVTDVNNCDFTQSFIINEPPLLEVSYVTQNISCAGASDGGIDLTITGGTPTYSVLWDNGATTEDLIDLGSGTYVYSIKDFNACNVTDTIDLFEPTPITFNAVVTAVTCRDQTDGTIEIFAEGGYGDFTYSWSHGTTANPVTNLPGTDYTVTITDLVGCSADTTITVPVTDIQCLEVPTAFTPNFDGYNDDWQITNIYLYPECSVVVMNEWGKIVYQIDGGYNEPFDGTFRDRDLPASTYYYIIDLKNDIKPYTGAVTIVR